MPEQSLFQPVKHGKNEFDERNGDERVASVSPLLLYDHGSALMELTNVVAHPQAEIIANFIKSTHYQVVISISVGQECFLASIMVVNLHAIVST